MRTVHHLAHRVWLIATLVIVIISIILSACSSTRPRVATGSVVELSPGKVSANVASSGSTGNRLPARTSPYALAQAENLPPVLIETIPASGEFWDGEPVVFVFDQPLADIDADALTIAPAIDGEVSVSGDRITYTPSQTPEPGVRYRFVLADTITGENGVSVAQTQEIALVGEVALHVTSTQPSAGSTEVSTDSPITVIFNRPIVPLVGIDEQDDLPHPLTFDPPIEGEGRWLNTSVYAFQPRLGLAGSTLYTVDVGEVTGLDGSTASAPHQFSFTTAAPSVVEVFPNDPRIRPDAHIVVDFSQAMDPDSTEAAFSLRQSGVEPSVPVEGTFGWRDDLTRLYFTPTVSLEFGGRYVVEVSTEAQPASRQGNLRSAFSRTLLVLPLPKIEAITPVNGATNVNPEILVTVRFNTPVSPTLALQNVSVTPLLTTTNVYSYYSEYSNELQLSWFKDPQTTYTVTIGGEIADEYGNTLGEDTTFSFTTGDHPAFARLDLDRFNHLTGVEDARFGVVYRNLDALDVALYRLPLDQLYRLTGSNQWSAWDNYVLPNPEAHLIWKRTYDTSGDRNVSIRQVVTLTNEVDESLAPGIYFVDVTPISTDTTTPGYLSHSQALIVLSNYNLVVKKSIAGDSLAWLTELATGRPVAGSQVRFLQEGRQIGEATTDEDGVVRLRLDTDLEMSWTPVLAMSGEPGSSDFSLVSSEWSNGIATWEFNISGGWAMERFQSLFYTDRPIYRPGQTVYWKGIVRELVNDQFELPHGDMTIHITVRDDMGNAIVEEDLNPDGLGTVTGEIALSPEARTGFYFLEARLGPPSTNQGFAGVGFQVAAYRTPEFDVSVTSDRPEYTNGDTVRVTVQAEYFSGGPLADAPVTWRLIADPYFFSWADSPRDRYYSFQPFDPDNEEYDPYRYPGVLGLLREGSGTTSADGTFTVEVPADLSQSLQSQNWTFDFTVQSATNQWVSGSVRFPVHKGEFYVGISPDSYVTQVDEEGRVDLITVTPDGERYPGAQLKVTIDELEWNSVYSLGSDNVYRWETSVKHTQIEVLEATTNRDGEASILWTPPRGGQYRLAVYGEDDQGNEIRSAVYVWVSSEDPDAFVAWPRENNDRIELVADKTLYAPGDTAKVLVPSPFAGPVRALVTLERGGILESRVIVLNGNSETLEIPIESAHIPNIYVGVVIAKGVDEANPVPAQRVGYVKLTVDTSEKLLSIGVEKSAERTEPGRTVDYTLTVTGADGELVEGAELSVALVDKALLSLAQGDTRAAIDVFYYERPLDISIGSLLTVNRDRMSQQLSEGAKGGGGGDGRAGIDVREDFPDIAFWRARLTTGRDGTVSFSIPLPDNLTTWQLFTRGVTADTRLGEASDELVVTKSLQVRPILPRFFTAGDRARIGALILNTTPYTFSAGMLTLDIAGATLADEGAEMEIANIAPGGQARYFWPVEVGAHTQAVTVTWNAWGFVQDEPNTEPFEIVDAVRMTLPVQRYSSPETVGTAGTVPVDGTLEAIRVPAAAENQGELLVTVEPTLAAAMTEGLEYLQHFPYECTEQTISRFLPNLFMVRALRALEIEDAELENMLSYQLGLGVQRLLNRQNQDGGWGFWPGEPSSPFITAYALWGLQNAQAMGYAVPLRTLDSAGGYLYTTFRAPSQVRTSWELNEMAFIHFVLSEMDSGYGDPGRAGTLYDVRERLGIYGKALLAMALHNLQEEGSADARIRTLLDDILGAATISATGAWWQESSIDYRTLNTDIRTTSIVLAAFSRIDPEEPILPLVVRRLMDAREAGRWSTTQENAWAIIGLTDWLQASGELEANYDWNVTLNDDTLGSGSVDATNLREHIELRSDLADLLRGEANALRFERSNDSGQLYYTTHLRYYLDALAIEPRDRGVVVDRRFALASGPETETISSAEIGDVISVTVSIVAPTDLYHVLVEVPIPAGIEPIDPGLDTTSMEFQDPSFAPVDEGNRRGWWYAWQPTYTDIRDDKVAFFATFLPAGAYEYTFQARASLAGEYRVLPVYAEEMYYPEVWGRSGGQLFTVTD